MAVGRSVSIAQFLECMRIRPRFHAPVRTMPLNVRIRFLLYPAQRIRAACAIGENRSNSRIGSEFLVEPFAESTQAERIAKDQYREIARRISRTWSALSKRRNGDA